MRGAGSGVYEVRGALVTVRLRLVDEVVRLFVVELVAVPVLSRGPLDVGDPVAILLRVVDGEAARLALRSDGLSLIQEPGELFLWVRGITGVVVLVPDRGPHLEEADRVRVAVLQVVQAGLCQ